MQSVSVADADLTLPVLEKLVPYADVNKIHRFKRLLSLGSFRQEILVETRYGWSFALSDLVNSSEFTSLYDSYRIEAVSVSFFPRQTQMTAAQSTTAIIFPRLYTTIDYNDADQTSISDLRQMGSTIESPPGTGIVRTFVPHVLNTVYGNSFGTSYGNQAGLWIDTNSPDVRHYGLKAAVEAGGPSQSANLQEYVVEATVYLAARNVR
jgi:hypothetical protein